VVIMVVFSTVEMPASNCGRIAIGAIPVAGHRSTILGIKGV
jgi:hypothetical protein